MITANFALFRFGLCAFTSYLGLNRLAPAPGKDKGQGGKVAHNYTRLQASGSVQELEIQQGNRKQKNRKRRQTMIVGKEAVSKDRSWKVAGNIGPACRTFLTWDVNRGRAASLVDNTRSFVYMRPWAGNGSVTPRTHLIECWRIDKWKKHYNA